MRKNSKRKIIITNNIGFCSGVDRAISLAEKYAKQFGKVTTLDAILHNEEELKRLREESIFPVRSVNEIKGKVILLPAHGATKKEIETAKKHFNNVVDTTCPLVLHTVSIIEKLKKENYKIAIVGDNGHRETKVLSDSAGENLLGIFKHPKEIEIKNYGKVGVVAQSTVFSETLFAVTKKFVELAHEVRFFNTVCDETLRRQREAVSVARKVGCMIVIGGKSSANSNRLYELVKRVNKNSFFIQNEEGLNKSNLSKCTSIGIASGTSTPKWLIEKIVRGIEAL